MKLPGLLSFKLRGPCTTGIRASCTETIVMQIKSNKTYKSVLVACIEKLGAGKWLMCSIFTHAPIPEGPQLEGYWPKGASE